MHGPRWTDCVNSSLHMRSPPCRRLPTVLHEGDNLRFTLCQSVLNGEGNLPAPFLHCVHIPVGHGVASPSNVTCHDACHPLMSSRAGRAYRHLQHPSPGGRLGMNCNAMCAAHSCFCSRRLSQVDGCVRSQRESTTLHQVNHALQTLPHLQDAQTHANTSCPRMRGATQAC